MSVVSLVGQMGYAQPGRDGAMTMTLGTLFVATVRLMFC